MSNCRLCRRLTISQAVTFADGSLVINLPAGSYADGQGVCIVVAQAIPEATTITAPVYISIGDGAERYPLIVGCCAQVSACSLRTRTRYATRVITSASGGSFRLLGRACCAPDNRLESINGGAAAETPSEGGA